MGVLEVVSNYISDPHQWQFDSIIPTGCVRTRRRIIVQVYAERVVLDFHAEYTCNSAQAETVTKRYIVVTGYKGVEVKYASSLAGGYVASVMIHVDDEKFISITPSPETELSVVYTLA